MSQGARTWAPAVIFCTLVQIVLRIPGLKVTEFLNGFQGTLEGEFVPTRNYAS